MVGYKPMMIVRSRDAIRRALAGLLVAALLAGVTPALAANEMVCKMTRHAAAPEPSCGACGPSSEAETGPSLKATSCCRFGAPGEAQTISESLFSPLRALPGLDIQATALAVAPDLFDAAAAIGSARPAAGPAAPRPSLTRSSILRL